MNPLLKRLAALRFKVRLLDGWQGVCALVALLIGVTLGVGLADYVLHLPTLFRGVLLVGLLITAATIVYRFFIRPFGKPCDDLNLALRVEETYPELNDALASTVQFLKQPKEELARLGGSAAMRDRTVADTVEKAAQCDFSRVLDLKGGLLFGAAAVGIVLLAGGIVGAATYHGHRNYVNIALWRFLEPFGGHTWTQVSVQRLKNDKSDFVDAYKPERVAIKQAYHIKVNLTGQLPANLKQARVLMDGGQIRTDSNETIIRDNDTAYFIKKFDVSAKGQKFKFRIAYNDGAFPARHDVWHEVEVLPEPKLVDLDNQHSPQITLYPPEYTDLPKRQLPAGVRNIEAYQGTKVVFRAKADRPLKEAWIVYQPANQAVVPSLVFSALGQTNPLQTAAGAVPWARIPVHLEDDGSVMSASFVPWLDGRYALYMSDEYELEGTESGELRILRDPEPKVNLVKPGTSVTSEPNGKVTFKFNVTDEFFAVKSVYVEYRRKGPDGAPLDEAPTRILLYEGKDFGKLIPEMFARAGYLNLPMRTHPKFPIRAADLRLRPTKLEIESHWFLKKQFAEGELVEIEICADDFCDIEPGRKPGRSEMISLRIVSKRDIVREAERKMQRVQYDIKRAEKLQREALETVKETGKKDKVEPKDIDKFIDNAESKQRAVKDIIGDSAKEGLRKELNDIRQMLKDNGLEGTKAYRDAGEAKGTLDNIAQQELQQIEPQIADVRNELTQKGQNSKESKAKLDQIARKEKNVADALGDLIRRAEPTAKLDEFKNQLRDKIDQQSKLADDLDQMKIEKQNLDKQLPDKAKELEKAFAEKINEKVREQNNLAAEMEKLIQQMKDEAVQQEKLGHKENAEKLKEAIQQLERPKREPMMKEPPIAQQMKQAGKDLQDKSEAPNKVIQQQKDIAQQMENALQKMEGKNEENTKQEIQNRKMAEKKIDEHNRELQKLRDALKKADMIENMEERLKAKQELAQQLEKAMDNIEKTRRELARLQEQGAADKLNQANDQIDNARKNAEVGDNADAQLKEAKEKLEQAKVELQNSEEQLVRELLIKMADELKLLKERQDSLLQRSEDFQPKVIRLKSWTDALVDTITGNLDAQKDVADETGTFKQKLKEAKVFHGLLDQAEKSMVAANDVMKKRRDELGIPRRYIEKGDGELMDAKEIEDENFLHGTTIKHQKQASQRLGFLLDALKEEIAKKPRPKKDPAQAQNDPKEEQPKGLPAQDGIPAPAQLKALKAAQLDLNERTKQFAERVPDPTKMTDAQRDELNGLHEEQEKLQELFNSALPQQQPMLKEGDMP
jgi:hypothetical protein